MASTECRLVDPETGEECAEGQAGELWVRGPQVMLGYHGNPTATAATLSADGWLRTGDLAEIDADGYMTIVDRVKELIKVSGFQVAPAELEALLLTHPAVADAAVVGVADEACGEVPKAFVVAAPGAALDVEAQALTWLTRCDCPVPALLATSGTRPLRWIALEWCGDRTLADVVAPKMPAGLGPRLAATCACVEAAFARLAGPNGGFPDGAAAELRRQNAPWVAEAPAALEWLLGPHPAGLGDVVLDALPQIEKRLASAK